MKLAEFNALCDREWAKKNRGGQGDVVLIYLTEASAEELSRDVLLAAEHFGPILPFDSRDVAGIRAGKPYPKVVNPITRTVVEIRTKPEGKIESARVRTPFGYRQARWPATA